MVGQHNVSLGSGRADGTVRQVATGIPTELVALDWNGSVPGEVELRSLTSAGWSAWVKVAGEPSEGPDAGSREFRNRTAAGPVWVGRDVTQVQFRVTQGQLDGLQLHAIRSEQAGGQPQTGPAGGAQPAIITRAQWGADESWRTFAPGCDGSVGYADNVHYLIVHHTVTSNNYGPADSAALIRGIYYFHTHTNLWCDIGYNFLVDQFGQVFEGRYGGTSRPVIGAHAGGFNTGSSGIALLGTFDTANPSPAMYNGLRALAGWKATIHAINPAGAVTIVAGSFPAAKWPPGTNVTIPTIVGHRDLEGTDCPGALAYNVLAQLRADVAGDVGTGWYRPWSGWTSEAPSPPVGINGAPAVAGWAINRFDQFGRGGDNTLQHRWSSDGGVSFSPWESLDAPPGGLTSSPAAVSWGNNRIDVFGRGADNALWHKWWDGTRWSSWESQGGVLTSAPAVSSWGLGRLDLFVTGTDHAVWHKWWDGARWSFWESRGGYGVFDPAATSWGPNRVDIFTVGSDGALYHEWWTGIAWVDWRSEVAGTWASGPAAASWGPGRIDLFATGGATGHTLIHAWNGAGWSSESLGQTLTAAPAAVSWRYNRLDVFAVGTDAGIWHIGYPGL